MFLLIRFLVAAILFAWGAGSAFAANEGQDDLDKATETKINARTISDLSEVIRLVESAQKSGLDETNTQFANQLLSSTLLQRARETVKQILASVRSIADFRKKREFALADLSRVVSLDPKQPEAHVLIAQLELLGGDKEAARKSIDKALELGLDEPLAQANALLLRSRLETDPEKQLADLDEAAKLASEDVEIIRARGLLLADLDKLEPALADLDKAIELDPENGPTYEAKAIVLARLKRFDESLVALEQAQKISPDSVMPLLQQARVHSHQEKPDAAMDDINRALKLDPTNAVILLMRSSIYQEKGEKDKALADVEEALKHKPDLPIAIRTHALLLADQERLDEAAQEMERLRTIEPKDPLTLLQLAVLYGMQKKTDKAIDTYTALIAESPEEWRAWRGRGDLHLGAGRHADAIADFEKALTLQPKDHGILNNLAWVLATSPDDKLRNGKRAIELATTACDETEYKLAYILSTLAAAYAETGDFDTAIKWSTKAVELDEKEHGEELKKELESYKAKKPWRELLQDSAAEPKKEKPSDKPTEKSEPADAKATLRL